MSDIGQRFRIRSGTVQNILERYLDSGGVTPQPQNAGRKPAFSGKGSENLEQAVLLHLDSRLQELRDRRDHGVSVVTMNNTVKKLGFTRNSVTTEGTAAAGCEGSTAGVA